MPYPTDPISQQAASRWGAAAKYEFDDPGKWHTESSVPLLDEHEMTNDDGQPIASVDRAVLEEIARNNNRNVIETGDPATIILGHTSDDPTVPEKPAKGFIVNYQVKPFKRDEQGRVIYAVHGDYKVRHKNVSILEDFPSRSVELWWGKKEIGPVAVLGGTKSERNLGMVIRNYRLAHLKNVSLNHIPNPNSVQNRSTDSGDDVIRFHARGSNIIESYSIEVPMATPSRNGRGRGASAGGGPARYGCDPKTGRPMKYGDAGMDTDDFDGGDDAVPDDGEGGGDSAENDPVVAKVMQSKQMKDLFAKLDMIAEAVGVGADQGQGDGMGDEGMGGEMPPPGAGGMDDGMGGGGGMDAMGGDAPMGGGMDAPGGDAGAGMSGMDPEEDARRMHGQRPVQMDAGGGPTSFPGPKNVNIPAFGKKPMPKKPMAMSRQQQRGTPVNATHRRSRTGEDPRDATIRRLRLKLARSEAERLVSDIEREGVIFSTDKTVAEKVKYARVEELTLAILHDEDSKDAGAPDTYVADRIEEMRTCYQRRRADPAAPTSIGLARFSRSVVPGTEGAEDEEFEPQDPQQASEMADMEWKMKLSRKEINSAMRKKYGRR